MEEELAQLKQELHDLRERYEQLEEQKRQMEQRYEAEIQKWKRFKKWVLVGGNKKAYSTTTTPKDTPDSHAIKLNDATLDPLPSLLSSEHAAKGASSPATRRTGKRDENKLPVVSEDLTRSPGSSSKAKSPKKKSPKRSTVAEPLSPSKISLNSRFRLNPAHNEGLNFQFEEVVRHKHDRSKLDAEDCECCREYYSALAPLPLPAQPPLWRSPPTTPQKKRKYDTFDSDEEPENATSLSRSVKQHVQKVSRHRRRWEAPKTPPGYWDIGFPDTQQTEEINKRAREMHADKLRNAEAEARIGGKYVRR